MTFDSVAYIFFLPIVWVTYLALKHRWQNAWLLAASYLFYGWWDVRLLSLIVLSTATDYCWALLISRDRLSTRQYLAAAGSFLAAFACFVVVPISLGWVGTEKSLPLDPLWALIGLVALAAAFPVLHRVLRPNDADKRKRAYLVVSLTSNLALLGVFKYYNFFIESAEALASRLGIENVSLLHLDLVLPVGISFYTFQTMSYVIDVYRGKAQATDKYLSFSLFVAYFPQLVAGPIERASHLLPAILSERRVTLDDVSSGAYLIILGLFKKIAIANGLADSVSSIYGTTGQVSGADVAVATVLFALQIYCDFSGYSDIARGSSKLFGISLMRNFEQPYFSANPSEFWRRWHISLSTWLRDYLYIALGGNRYGPRKTYRNLMATMLLGGLWHGAAWNFVLWGFYQGLILCVHRFLTSPGRLMAGWQSPRLKFVFVPLFFVITCYGWLLFRAESFEQIAQFSLLLLTDWHLDFTFKSPTFAALLGVTVLMAVEAFSYAKNDPYFYRSFPVPLQGFYFSVLVFVTFMGLSNSPTQFIYFQF